MMPATKTVFDVMGDVILELSSKNESLKNKINSCDTKWLEESKAKLLNQFDDDKRANIIISRRPEQIMKQ